MISSCVDAKDSERVIYGRRLSVVPRAITQLLFFTITIALMMLLYSLYRSQLQSFLY